MKSPEGTNSAPQERIIDIESRDKVKGVLVPLMQEIDVVVEASLLRAGTKQKMREFLSSFMYELEDDTIVERAWVTFAPNGEIRRARSEDGVYDLDNTLRYLWSELMSNFFSPISVAFSNETREEMAGVRKYVQDLIETV